MQVNITTYRKGSQERPYGPRVHDFTITIEPGPNGSYMEPVFDTWARKVIKWSDEPKWYEWRLIERKQVGDNTYWYRVEQPYDD